MVGSLRSYLPRQHKGGCKVPGIISNTLLGQWLTPKLF